MHKAKTNSEESRIVIIFILFINCYLLPVFEIHNISIHLTMRRFKWSSDLSFWLLYSPSPGNRKLNSFLEYRLRYVLGRKLLVRNNISKTNRKANKNFSKSSWTNISTKFKKQFFFYFVCFTKTLSVEFINEFPNWK